jgi:8-oxo-dGTP diphosphatase
MTSAIPEFGEPAPGANYVLRPGGYVILFRPGNEVATVLTPSGYALPGGGQDPGESPADAAIREAAEECGLVIEIGEQIAMADELSYAQEEATHYRKRSTFFLVRIIGTTRQTQLDHELTWLSIATALEKLMFASQRWALKQALSSVR